MAEKIHKAEPPGIIYQQGKGWWWKVRLPGEKRIRERALKPKGARFATEKIEEAQEIALGLWQAAIERVAKAEVRAQAWAMAKKKARAHAKEIAQIKAEADETIAMQKAVFAEKVGAYTKAVTEAQAKAKAQAEARAQAEAKLAEMLGSAVSTGTCECCGRDGVPEDELVRIDSGQFFCPDCLEALRA